MPNPPAPSPIPREIIDRLTTYARTPHRDGNGGNVVLNPQFVLSNYALLRNSPQMQAMMRQHTQTVENGLRLQEVLAQPLPVAANDPAVAGLRRNISQNLQTDGREIEEMSGFIRSPFMRRLLTSQGVPEWMHNQLLDRYQDMLHEECVERATGNMQANPPRANIPLNEISGNTPQTVDIASSGQLPRPEFRQPIIPDSDERTRT